MFRVKFSCWYVSCVQFDIRGFDLLSQLFLNVIQSRSVLNFASVIEGGVNSVIKYVMGNCHSLEDFTTTGVFSIVAMFSLIHSLFRSLLILT